MQTGYGSYEGLRGNVTLNKQTSEFKDYEGMPLMRTVSQNVESVTVQTKGEYKTSNDMSSHQGG